MAVTSLKDLQEQVGAFALKHNLENPPEVATLDLVSEIGEVAKEILKSTNYGKSTFTIRPELKEEIGDVFYSLICLANYHKIDLEQALLLVLDKYLTRIEKGGAGSENV